MAYIKIVKSTELLSSWRPRDHIGGMDSEISARIARADRDILLARGRKAEALRDRRKTNQLAREGRLTKL